LTLTKLLPTQGLSQHKIQIEIEADDIPDGADNLQVTLCVEYTKGYPDELPILSLEHEDERIEEADSENILEDLRKVGEENLGMAMTFTLVSHLREQLSQLVRTKLEEQRQRDSERERLALEAEEKRTIGTLVTVESFKAWKEKFDKELAIKKLHEDEEHLKNMTPKERDEWKKSGTRLTGRQLFERNKNLEDETLIEEGVVSVDFSQYERTREEEEQESGLTFSDSD